MSNKPEWFKNEPGFNFFDRDGDLYVVLGTGKWRDVKPIGNLELYPSYHNDRMGFALSEVTFEPEGTIVAFFYKGEWHLADCDKWLEYQWNGCQPAT